MAQQVCCSGLDLLRARGELAHDSPSVLGRLVADGYADILRELIDGRIGD